MIKIRVLILQFTDNITLSLKMSIIGKRHKEHIFSNQELLFVYESDSYYA
jgi:hypothetical protein